MNPGFPADVIESMVSLHLAGNTNVRIANSLNVAVASVTRHLRKHGYTSRRKGKIRKMLDANTAECSKCGRPKPVDLFTANYSYCNECLWKYKSRWTVSTLDRFLKVRVIQIRARAREAGTPCSLTTEDLLDLYSRQSGRCFYTDRQMSISTGEGHRNDALSVDRIVPKLGYVKGNMVLCTYQVNKIKNDVSLDEMKEWMPGWYSRLTTSEDFAKLIK
jgi:hypothetical protein